MPHRALGVRWHMNASLLRPLLILASGMLTAPSLAVAHDMTSSPTATSNPGIPAQPEPMNQWLDEVRAQRQTREERRRIAKETIDARRRWIDPWGAAQQEAREKENQRRREAFRNQIDQDRDAFRNHVPWYSPQAPWTEPPPSNDLPRQPAPPGPDNRDTTTGTPDPLFPYPPLPGWDNRWYYRGY